MNKCLNRTNYGLIIALLILYGNSISSFIHILLHILSTPKEKLTGVPNAYLVVTNLVSITLVTISTLIFGLYSLCFLSKIHLSFYIITLIYMIIFEVVNIFLMIDIIAENPHRYTIISFIFSSLDFLFCLLNLIICLIIRDNLLREIKESPLNSINLDITEDDYNKIVNNQRSESEYKMNLGELEGPSPLPINNSISEED